MTPLETIAADWLAQHPEYDSDFADVDSALAAQFTVQEGKTNPFLHLSMHLSITEQTSIDQPRGIREAVRALAERRHSLHEAHHEVMEALGEMVWESQRFGRPFDGEAYIERIRQRSAR
ncbi:MAG: hypothetical protein RI907_2610 [Pseudomonadota bacterium]